MGPVLFFSKCKPQGADAWPIARETKRVFLGYPVFRKAQGLLDQEDWKRLGTHSFFVDLLDPEWESVPKDLGSRGYKAQITGNRNLAMAVGLGSIVLVPRIADGVCYAGRVTGIFHLVDTPTWVETYLNLRREAGLSIDEVLSHVGDIVQSWQVDDWRKISFPSVPRWISYRLLSRNTAGIIWDLESPTVSAWGVMDQLLRQPTEYLPQPASVGKDLERRLLDWVSPSGFEHLVVDLLQLDAPEGVFWHHVGGSGDGGVDGIAVTESGTLHARLQCKWHSGSPPRRIAKGLTGDGIKAVVAILIGHQSSPQDLEPGTFLNRERIVELILKHRDRLPLAKSLGL